MTQQAVSAAQARFSHAVIGVVVLEALVFDAWPAILVAIVISGIEALPGGASPLRWAFARLGATGGHGVEQPVYRLANISIATGLGTAAICFVSGAAVAGFVFAAVVGAVAILGAIVGLGPWRRAAAALPGVRIRSE